MAKIELKRFTNYGVLLRIEARQLVSLLDRFKEELKGKNWGVTKVEPGCECFYTGFAGMFKSPESLPEALAEAVMAMEEQVANWPCLEAVLAQVRRYRMNSFDTTCTRESLALQLWLWCPYRVGSNLAEVEVRIEAGRKVWEEKDRADREYQAREDERLRLKEGTSTPHPGPLHPQSPSPLTPLPSDVRGETVGGEGEGTDGAGSATPQQQSGDEDASLLPSAQPMGRGKWKFRKLFGGILPAVRIDSDAALAKYFVTYQINWIKAEDAIHAQHKQVFALAEKSVRIGWTHADGFKNVRKRLRFKNRPYLFVTKDYPSALEYMVHTLKFAEFFNVAKSIVAHGEDYLKVDRLDEHGKRTGFTDEVKMGYIKFDNGSSIRAFSSHPQAMAVYGGDVGLDEFAKHPNARLLWETAQGRMTWAYDMAVWSAHDGEDTLFYEFAQEARAGRGPWNLYYRITMLDAIQMGLLNVINRVRDTSLKPEQFIADCKSRSRLPEVYEQTYLCNPAPSAQGIVAWSAIEHCRWDYKIERVHLEAEQIHKQFGAFRPETQYERAHRIQDFIHKRFLPLFQDYKKTYRAGFDVAASGEGDLTVIYIDERKGPELWLRGLFSCRTEDWDFIETVLYAFMQQLPSMQMAGDETGVGRHICWKAANSFPGRFTCVNFSSRKHDIGFALMNQLAGAEKRFPRSELDIATDYLALRKTFRGNKWVFSEGANDHNAASHCDIAWAGGLATEADSCQDQGIGAMVGW